MKYLFRKSHEEDFKANFEGEFLSDTLRNKYDYIYESMKANNYNIRFDDYSILFELISDEKVVGFAAYIIPQAATMTLTETYVLPEFESENLLLKSILMLLTSGSTISIVEPTRDVVEFLIDNKFATKLTDSIITSSISFDMLEEDIIGNNHLKGIVPSTNLYDLNLCSPIFLYNISTPGTCEIFYLKALDADDKKYKCEEFRNSIDIDDYFMDIKKVFLKNSDEFNQTLIDLKDSLPKSYLDYREIIGDGDELSDYFEGMVENGMFNRKKAIKIRNQLKKEYENEEVTDQSLALRVTFLIGEDDFDIDTKTFEDVAFQFDSFCPYCHSHVSSSSLYCQTCGYNISKTGLISVENIKK